MENTFKTVTYPKNIIAVTHNGVFHADDVIGAIILRRVFPNMSLKRTRDPNIIESADIVFDVGGQYDGEKYFDHHFKDSPKRDNGVKYSSAGLLFKKYHVELGLNDEEYEIMDSEFIQAIDAVDNGEVQNSDCTILQYSGIISSFNPNWDEHNNFDQNFNVACLETNVVFERIIKNIKSKVAAMDYVNAALNNREIPEVLILDKFVPWQRVVFESRIKDVVYCIYPSNEIWMLQCIPPSEKEFTSQRRPLPKNWFGLRDKEFQEITGIEGSVFCHQNGFIAGVTSKESAIKLANLAILNYLI